MITGGVPEAADDPVVVVDDLGDAEPFRTYTVP
jgi:hypothetical protein